MTERGDFVFDSSLVKRAERTEDVIAVDGETSDGVRVLVLVATGANIGLLKRQMKHILPGMPWGNA